MMTIAGDTRARDTRRARVKAKDETEFLRWQRLAEKLQERRSKETPTPLASMMTFATRRMSD